MKFCHLSISLLVILLAHHSHQQTSNFNPLSSLTGTGNSINDNSNSGLSNSRLVGSIRNTTSNLLTRLNGPRDRVIALIKPAVKSDLSRNITNVLNSIWSRVQGTNSSIIQNSLIRSSIVIPINTTLERLKQITAKDDESAEVSDGNVEIINLNNPEEEQHFREYIMSSASSKEEESNPVLLLVADDKTAAAAEENLDNYLSKNKDDSNEDAKSKDDTSNSQVNDDKSTTITADEIEQQQPKITANEIEKQQPQAETEPQSNEQPNEPVKSLKKRSSRFMDSYSNTVVNSPDRMRNFFDRVQENRMRECLGLAICESNCRPNLYGGEQGSFRRFFDRAQSQNEFDHQDYSYYQDARRQGQQYNSNYYDDCSFCHRRYYCPHDRQHLMNSFSRMGDY